MAKRFANICRPARPPIVEASVKLPELRAGASRSCRCHRERGLVSPLHGPEGPRAGEFRAPLALRKAKRRERRAPSPTTCRCTGFVRKVKFTVDLVDPFANIYATR